MRPNAISFLLHYGAKLENYGLVLTCFSLSCYPSAVSLSRVAFHMEFEKYAVSSPLLKLPELTLSADSIFTLNHTCSTFSDCVSLFIVNTFAKFSVCEVSD